MLRELLLKKYIWNYNCYELSEKIIWILHGILYYCLVDQVWGKWLIKWQQCVSLWTFFKWKPMSLPTSCNITRLQTHSDTCNVTGKAQNGESEILIWDRNKEHLKAQRMSTGIAVCAWQHYMSSWKWDFTFCFLSVASCCVLKIK
jgi:hypothetical protein